MAERTMTGTADCLSDDRALGYVDGTLPAASLAVAEEHIDRCSACRWLVSALARPSPGEDAPEPRPRLRPAASDRYLAGDVVARGGQGCVRRGTDTWFGREVAIKEPINPGAARHLVQEALITARLQHPAILPIYDAGYDDDGRPFYTMKLVDGRSLQQAIAATGTLHERLALLPRVIAVAEAIAYAHSRRVIHRDLKPANILVGDFGDTVVIDWGLAQELGGADAEPGGAIVGTPGYMSPEQTRGAPVDERTDVFALGAILRHLLTGSPPREQSALPRAAPRDLVTIVAKAMAADPADRYPSAGELAADLQRFATGQLVSAQVYSPLALLGRWVRRHRAAVAAAAAALVAIAVIAAVSVRAIVAERDRARAEQRAAERARAAADEQRTTAERERAAADQQRRGAQGLVEFMLGSLDDRLEQIGRIDLLEDVATSIEEYYARGIVDPFDLTASRRRARALAILGKVAQSRGDYLSARRHYQDALAIRDGVFAVLPQDTGNNYVSLELRDRLADVTRLLDVPAAPRPAPPQGGPLLLGDGLDTPLEIPLRVVLWEHAHFGGDGRTLVRDQANLGPGWAQGGRCQSGMAFEDVTSAVGVHVGPDYDAWKARHGGAEPVVILWSDRDFRGAYVVLQAGVYPDLSAFGLDDSVSSVQFAEGRPLAPPSVVNLGGRDRIPVVLRLHTAPRRQVLSCGEADNVFTAVRSIYDIDPPFDDAISWIEILRGPNYDATKSLTLYSERFRRGDTLTSRDAAMDLDLAARGFDDKLSSVFIEP